MSSGTPPPPILANNMATGPTQTAVEVDPTVADPTVDVEHHMAVQEIKGIDEKGAMQLNDELTFNRTHVEASAVDDVYARKVFIFNKIMNEHIGMTWWQWGLLGVAGVGWLIDNAWLQLIAIILPQVAVEFNVEHPEFITIALYAGLICGAATWGLLADILGRRLSFNITLFIAGVFGLAAGGATNFTALGALLGAMGFGLGGSLPVDGMLFLEFLPGNRQQLLTLLSVFWSLGQLLSSLVGWGFISKYNCTRDDNGFTSCVNYTSRHWMAGNEGWRYLVFTIGAFTLVCFFLRFVVFQIPESPKFLLSRGRDAEAVEAMKRFATLCGRPLPDDMLSVGILRSAAGQDGLMDEQATTATVPPRQPGLVGKVKHSIAVTTFNARSLSKPSLAHIKPLFASFSMGYTTAVIWAIWALIGLAYPLFNSFIIMYIKPGGDTSLSRTYRDYVIISVCGVPGSLFATWLVDLPRSGRRGAMALGTLLSGIFLFGFTTMHGNPNGTLAFSCVVSFTENIMYGVLYCYTPESFPAPLRGTADGIASSLNRVFGLFAPIIKIYGVPKNASTSQAAAPIYVAASLFILSGLMMLTLRVETSARTAL